MSATEVVTAIATRPITNIAAASESEWSVERIVEQTMKIKQCMQAVMKADEHYGVIPGTSSKPSLLKPGAEKLCLMFRLNPEYETEQAVEEVDFILFRIKCTLKHIPTGNSIASGLGSCSSREDKYGWRKAARKCPKCQKEAILKSKNDGEGWFCWRKKDGCGATFRIGDASIEKQEVGKVPVENVWDQHNTILKMACKRALIAAVLNGTAASDFFTQDLEDLTEKAAEYTPPPPPAAEEPPKKSPGALQRPRGPARGAKGQTADATPAPAEQPPAPEVASDLYKDLEASVMVDVVDQKTGEVKRYPRVTAEQIKKIHVLRNYCRIDDGDWKGRLQAKYGVTTSKDLAKFQASDLIERLQKMADRARQAAEEIAPELEDDKGDEPTPEEMRGDPKRDPEER